MENFDFFFLLTGKNADVSSPLYGRGQKCHHRFLSILAPKDHIPIKSLLVTRLRTQEYIGVLTKSIICELIFIIPLEGPTVNFTKMKTFREKIFSQIFKLF